MACVSCQGPVRRERCWSCRRWQLTCEACGLAFAARRRTARSCSAACEKRAGRRRIQIGERGQSQIRNGLPQGNHPRNIADMPPEPVSCASCGVVLAGLEGPLPVPSYCLDCTVAGVP